MKKIFLLICLTIFLSTPTVQATMTEYKNPSFSFDKIKNILILNTKQDSQMRNRIANEFAFQQVDQMLGDALVRSGVRFNYASNALQTFDSSNEKTYATLVTEQGKEKADAIFFAWASIYYDAYLTPVLIKYQHTSYRVPSYVRTETVIDKTRIYDNKGNYTTIETPRTVYETVPERYYKTSDVCINFSLYSTTDHTEIYLLKDDRSRNEEGAFEGMVKRISESLAKKLYANMPNAQTK